MKNSYRNEDIISIESSDWEMILNGEKWVLFQKDFSETLKKEINDLYPNTKAVYANKTYYLRDSKTGLLLGEATTYLIFYLLYDDEKENSHYEIGLAKVRNAALKEIYLKWCSKKSIKPNYNEGWFKSKKFSAYLDKICWGSNYALFIGDIVKYDTARKIGSED